MYNSSGLIPAKFLTLIAHLTISATLLWSSLESVRICLPENYPEDVLLMQQKQLIVGLSVTLGMIAFELLAFLSGVTMFHPTSALLSIICHASACVILCYLVFDSWQCGWYWWIFAFCSVLPVLNDLCIVFDVILKRKY